MVCVCVCINIYIYIYISYMVFNSSRHTPQYKISIIMCYMMFNSSHHAPQCKLYTVKLEMFADINVCEFVILKVFALLMFDILGLPK